MGIIGTHHLGMGMDPCCNILNTHKRPCRIGVWCSWSHPPLVICGFIHYMGLRGIEFSMFFLLVLFKLLAICYCNHQQLDFNQLIYYQAIYSSGKKTIVNGLYHLFMVIWGMVYYCFTHIIYILIYICVVFEILGFSDYGIFPFNTSVFLIEYGTFRSLFSFNRSNEME